MKRFTNLSTIIILLLCSNTHFGQETKPQIVYTGVYLMNIYDLNLDEHSFFADFYIWFKWKGDIDPTDFEFVNAVEKWGMTMVPFEDSTLTLSGGWNYQGYRVESRFFQPFLLDRFPLDHHALEIHIENPDYPLDSLVFLPDTSTQPATYRPELMLAGWDITHTSLRPTEHHYNNHFGNPDNPASSFSDLVFSFQLTRPISYFLLKLLLPLSVVIFAALGALLFFPSYVDARISLPVGSLLTAVFLQQSYSDALPDIGYMTLMDMIYLLAYGLIVGVMVRIIYSGNQLGRLGKKGADNKQIRLKEKRLAFGFSLIYVAGVLLLIWLS